MVRPSEKLSEPLEVQHALQENRVVAIRSADLTRTLRERLCKNGFLHWTASPGYSGIQSDEI